ncbi:MAG: hypothetical protein IKP31_05055 [Lachnospiraceae bacterium]|nr:hypothetical protein [Lachnospiraceae bacterium]
MAINTSAVQETAAAYQTGATSGVSAKKNEYGRTIGEPKLSDEGKKYYEELKKKFGGYDFILVSKDQIDNAKSQAARYANPNKPVVLIDEEKIEKMATDKDYREKYESVIAGASSQLSKMKDQLMASGADFKGFGIQVNDGGTASFFAVVKKSQDAQADRIEKKREESKAAHKAADKKAAAKRAEKKRAEKKEAEKLKEKRLEDGLRQDIQGDDQDREMTAEEIAENNPRIQKALGRIWEENTVTISASSVDELITKLGDYAQNERMNQIQTPEEAIVGQHIDFKG